MTDEKNPILNPQAEGSNAASGSKNKGKERASETEGNFVSIEKEMERHNLVDLSLNTFSEKQNQLAHELENSKQVLIRVKELMTDKEREAQVKITELDGIIKEQNKQLSTAQQEANNLKEKFEKRNQE
ncbi:9197_t:CDS:2 [Paraglomus occultum]|uniref:9197_t:CDS:1 n=1 Tax=Paraglomus occultum TaxID=144539 RepID=A0A9N9GTC8_9GLOM|nr:9197_t:CDS:2 [Paraglomus occultum]